MPTGMLPVTSPVAASSTDRLSPFQLETSRSPSWGSATAQAPWRPTSEWRATTSSVAAS
jgi:hypothetical protein